MSVVTRLDYHDEHAWKQIETILLDSFSPDSLRSVDAIRSHSAPSAAAAFGTTFLQASISGETVGFLIGEQSGDRRLAYLWYMAVAKSHRSKGVGSDLLNTYLQNQMELRSADFAVLEIDPFSCGVMDERLRRYLFYIAHGCLLLPVVMTAPPFGDEEGSGAHQYFVMVRPLSVAALRFNPSELAAQAVSFMIMESRLNGQRTDDLRYLDASFATIGAWPVA